jgi:hypothetical protein
MPGGTGFAAIQISLHIFFRQLQARRATVDNAAQGRAVTLTKGGDGEQLSECISRHNSALYTGFVI